MTKAQIKRVAITTAAAGIMALASTTASAQSAACVHLKVGAGYAAWMRVVSKNFSSDWSDSFPIGQTMCQSLTSIADGQPYTVQVSAVLGSSKVPCKPDNLARSASNTASVTYMAWGTTLDVQCQMPSAENAAKLDASTAASKEGMDAAQNIKSQGAKLTPPK